MFHVSRIHFLALTVYVVSTRGFRWKTRIVFSRRMRGRGSAVKKGVRRRIGSLFRAELQALAAQRRPGVGPDRRHRSRSSLPRKHESWFPGEIPYDEKKVIPSVARRGTSEAGSCRRPDASEAWSFPAGSSGRVEGSGSCEERRDDRRPSPAGRPRVARGAGRLQDGLRRPRAGNAIRRPATRGATASRRRRGPLCREPPCSPPPTADARP